MVTFKTSARDSAATRRRILDAVGRIIVDEGLAAVGVNALARAACCDKVLIYRYFGDLDGVCAAFAEQTDFWWRINELTSGLDPSDGLAAALKAILRRHAGALRRRPTTLAVLAAEFSQRMPLVIALETLRERRALELNAWIAGNFALPAGVDLAATMTLIGVAFNYLAARAVSTAVMGGVDIGAESGWQRLFAAADALIDGLLRPT